MGPSSASREEASTPLLSEAQPEMDVTPPLSRRFVRLGALGAVPVLVLISLALVAVGAPRQHNPFASLPPVNSTTWPVVTAAGNRWSGFKSAEDQLTSFLALPYANPPVRFRKAEPYSGSLYNETARVTQLWETTCSSPISLVGQEDCLHLNVVVPTEQKTDKLLPVMLYFHAGGYVGGSAMASDPTALVLRSIVLNKPVVFVSANYRLGALGFSAAPLHNGGPPLDLDLNVGFHDQLLALEWVHAHVRQFGGDPARVTLVGASAGAMSISLHQMYSPRHLSRGAFLLSGVATSFPVPSAADATVRTLHALGGSCVPPPTLNSSIYSEFVECLRDLPIETIMELSYRVMFQEPPATFVWLPVLEGEGGWLNERPAAKIRRGDYAYVPLVAGNVADEGPMFLSTTAVDSTAKVMDMLRGMAPYSSGKIEQLLPDFSKLYPEDGSGSPYGVPPNPYMSAAFKMASSLVGDIWWHAPRRFLLSERAKRAGLSQWSYLYDELTYGLPEYGGVAHLSDLGLFFGIGSSDQHTNSRALELSAYLINFVSDLNPNGPHLSEWPIYDSDRKIIHFSRLGTTTQVIRDDFRAEGIDYITEHNDVFTR